MTIIRLVLKSPNNVKPSELEIWINPKNIKQMGLQIPKIKKFLIQGYKLKKVIGKGVIADFLRTEQQKYNTDIKNYRIDAIKITKKVLRMKKNSG